jgi:hypothetical protein
MKVLSDDVITITTLMTKGCNFHFFTFVFFRSFNVPPVASWNRTLPATSARSQVRKVSSAIENNASSIWKSLYNTIYTHRNCKPTEEVNQDQRLHVVSY